jgi:hypothetical protein
MLARRGKLIDDQGVIWADDSFDLLHRLGRREADFNLAAYAIRNLGYIHLRPYGAGLCVAVRAKAFSQETLIATIYEIVDWAPERILLAVFADEQWHYQLCPSLGSFTAKAEALAAGEPITNKRWFSLELDPKTLRSRTYAAVHPMLRYWKATRGRMEDDFWNVFRGGFFQQRGTLVRRASPSSFICEHFGIGIKAMRPCEALRIVGRDIADAPDHEYASWVAESFAEAANGVRPRISTVRARINTSDGGAINGSYNRVLLPWRRGRGDTLVLGMSILRERSVVA